MLDPRLTEIAASQPHPLLFATVSGAHLYGFPSPDSDYDLRGAHILPLADIVGLLPRRETIEVSRVVDGLELDLVTHDVSKFLSLLLKKNGYVLEQLLSPLVVHTTPAHAELCALAPRLFTRYHAHHYLGFAATQWKLFEKEQPRRVKPLLYVFRVLLTGLHLLEAGELNANLLQLNEVYRLPYVVDLVARKLAGPEQSQLDAGDIEFYRREYERLCAELKAAIDTTHLPAATEAGLDLHQLLVRVRLSQR